MTVAEIYQQILYNVFGNTPNIPAMIPGYLRGDEGRIAKAHRLLQIDTDYWFMRKTQRYRIPSKKTKTATFTTIAYDITLSDTNGLQAGMAVVNDNLYSETYLSTITPPAITQLPKADATDVSVDFYVRRLQLPSDFKTEKVVVLRIDNNGYQLKRVSASEAQVYYRWDIEAVIPSYYWFYNDYMCFDVNLLDECELILDYYSILTYNDADNYEDEILIRGADVIINYCSFAIASILQDIQKAQYFAQMYTEAVGMLRRENLMRESAFNLYDARIL